jgi:hypothetical protein
MFSEYLQVSFDIIRGEWTDFGPSVIRPRYHPVKDWLVSTLGMHRTGPFLCLVTYEVSVKVARLSSSPLAYILLFLFYFRIFSIRG